MIFCDVTMNLNIVVCFNDILRCGSEYEYCNFFQCLTMLYILFLSVHGKIILKIEYEVFFRFRNFLKEFLKLLVKF